MNNRSFGAAGERAAEAHLAARGALLLARNYRCRFGEIDLIARMEGKIVFVEVKRRTNFAHGAPAQAVTIQKQRRIALTASCYLRENALADAPVRFDVVEVTPSGVRHIPAAFYPPQT